MWRKQFIFTVTCLRARIPRTGNGFFPRLGEINSCRVISLTLFLFFTLLCGSAPALSIEVNVQGVEGVMLQSILANLSLEKQKSHPYLNDTLVRRLHAQAPDEISRALQIFGYYQPSIKTRLDQEGDRYTADYKVSIGDPVIVVSTDIRLSGEGAAEDLLKSHVKDFPLAKGQPLVHTRYESGKKELLSAAVNKGYLDAAYTENRVLVSTEERTARIVLHLETGPRFTFGRVSFRQDFLSRSYLEGYVTIHEGHPYDQTALLDLQKALYDSNQFSRVEVAAPRSEARGLMIPVTVTLDPGPTRRFTAGVGYGTDTGPRFRTGWEHRRLNRKVHRLRTDLLLSEIQSSLSGLYTVPLKRPRTDHLDYSLALNRERVEDIDSVSVLLGFSHVRLRGRAQLSEYMRYLWEDYNVATDEDRTALLYPGVGLTYVRADDRVNTRKGFRLDFELQGAEKGFLSGFSFLQASAKAKFIEPLGSKGRLILRGERATTWINDFQELPSSLRYFAGGDQSVRGFAYKSLSPLDASGEAVGGRYLIVASVEYEHKLSESWRAALFSDTGNALEEANDTLERGAGAGLRWQSIIGLIRLDVAWALTREGRPWRVHLNIGPDL